MSEQDSVSQWCAAGEQGDAGRAARCLAQDVELISPLTEQFRFVGREQVRELLTAAFTAINGNHAYPVCSAPADGLADSWTSAPKGTGDVSASPRRRRGAKRLRSTGHGNAV